MRVFGPVVHVATAPVLHLGQNIAMRNAIAAKAIRHQALWLVLQPGEQAFEETLGARGIASVLDQDVEHHPMVIDSTPEIIQLAFFSRLAKLAGVAR